MPVPVIFSTFPGGSSIPLADLDLCFAYCTTSPAFTGSISVGGNLTVGGSSNFVGPITANDLTVNGSLTIDGVTVNPTGVTGSGLLVLNTGPTLVAPILGTPASGNLTNCTGYQVNQISGMAAGVIPFLTNPTTANLAAAVVDETGTGNLVLSNNPTLTSPTLVAPVLGTPASGNLSACTGYPAPNLAGVVPVANGGTGLSATGTVGQVLGVSAPGVLGYFSSPPSANLAGGAASQIVYQSAPNTTAFIANGTAGQPLISNGAAVPSWGQISLTAAVTGVLPIANGGTNSASQQGAINNLVGSVAAATFLRGNGADAVMAPIQASDVPILNQNTTGTAGNVSGVVAIANGGTGQVTANAAINALLPVQGGGTTNLYLKSNGSNTLWDNPHGAAAYAYFDPTGAGGGFNISSIVKNSAGRFTVNFSTALSTTNYSLTGFWQGAASYAAPSLWALSFSTTSVSIGNNNGSGGAFDANYYWITVTI